MKYIFLIIFSLAIFCGCNPGNSPEQNKEALEQNVLAIHDSAMAKMDDIYHLRRDLRALRDTLEKQPQTDSVILKNLQVHIQSLNQADKTMMDWMHQYKAPDEMDKEQAITYLQQQLSKIQQVQTTMDSTIEAAHSTYNSYDQHK